MKYLQNVKFNLLLIVLTAALCFVLFHKSDVLEGAGMAAIFLNWMPVLIGIGTLLLYLLAQMITKTYGWIVTILGCLFNVLIIIGALVQ